MRIEQHTQVQSPSGATRAVVDGPLASSSLFSWHTCEEVARWLLLPPENAPRATLLVRLMAGGVFFSEGILKFVYPNQGVGRFTKLGFAFPELTATAIASLEIVGGALLIAGLLTRVFGAVFVIEMMVAFLATKVGLYLGTSPLPPPPSAPTIGVWAVLHESRSDYAQLLSCLFLLFVGSGPWSLDTYAARWWLADRARRRMPL